MSKAHVCDECKTVAPIGEAQRWWGVETLGDVLMATEKPEYHFCSWACLRAYADRRVPLMTGAWR